MKFYKSVQKSNKRKESCSLLESKKQTLTSLV